MRRRWGLAVLTCLLLNASCPVQAGQEQVAEVLSEMISKKEASCSLLIAVGKGEAEAAFSTAFLRASDVFSGGAAVTYVSANGTVREAAADPLFYRSAGHFYLNTALVCPALTAWNDEWFPEEELAQEEIPFAQSWAELPIPLLELDDVLFLRVLEEQYLPLIGKLSGDWDEESGILFFGADGLEEFLKVLPELYEQRVSLTEYKADPDQPPLPSALDPVFSSLLGSPDPEREARGLFAELFGRVDLETIVRDMAQKGWEITGSLAAGKDKEADTCAAELLISASAPQEESREEEELSDRGIYLHIVFIQEPLPEDEIPEAPEEAIPAEKAVTFLGKIAERLKELQPDAVFLKQFPG